MISSVLNEGVRGLQNSQRDLARAATDIARAGVRPEATLPETERDVPTALAPIEESAETERPQDISESLIELRRQEVLFNASAEVVSAADQTIGNLLDTDA